MWGIHSFYRMENWSEYLLKEYKRRKIESELPISEDGSFLYHNNVNTLEKKVLVSKHLYALEDLN